MLTRYGFLSCFLILTVTPALAWADIAPTSAAFDPVVFIPVLVLFCVGLGAVVYLMSKKRKERASNQLKGEQD